MQVLSRSELGCRDEFQGFVFFKDENPAVQLHLYDDYYTLFWRGKAAPDSIGGYLGKAVEDICKKIAVPFASLNKGVVQYALRDGIKTFPFELVTDRWNQHRILLEAAKESHGRWARQATFARFDIQSSLKLPIILWADLVEDEGSEVGFSTTVELPAAVLDLLKQTCSVEITEPELEEIRGHVQHYVLEPVNS